MGCDIHLVLEKRHNGKWIAVDTFNSFHRAHAKPDDIMDGFCSPTARSQNYERFAALAGVRGRGPEPRGVPDDASETARYMIDQWGDDGHSHSWLPLKDAASIFLATQDVPEGKSLSEFVVKWPEGHFFNVDCSQGSGQSIDDYRLLFWFDN